MIDDYSISDLLRKERKKSKKGLEVSRVFIHLFCLIIMITITQVLDIHANTVAFWLLNISINGLASAICLAIIQIENILEIDRV